MDMFPAKIRVVPGEAIMTRTTEQKAEIKREINRKINEGLDKIGWLTAIVTPRCKKHPGYKAIRVPIANCDDCIRYYIAIHTVSFQHEPAYT